MAFHETFWAVTAGAAPVLGLAAVLQVMDSVRFMHQVDDFAIPLMKLRNKAFEGKERTEETFKEEFLTGTFAKQLARNDFNYKVVAGIVIGQAANILAQAVLLAVSLLAILNQANEGPPLLWIAVAVFGLVILSAAGTARLWVRWPGIEVEI